MLNQKYQYIGLDFETTGLNPKKDEAIQIALVQFDYTGKIIKQFDSLLSPSKEIKSMAGFITGITMEDLVDAPVINDLELEIKSFFGPDTIVIGHNIAFDMRFLNKYFPDIEYADTIDTFQLSQALIHFAPSHALEVLGEYLKIKHSILEQDATKKKQYHDALYDTHNAIALFIYSCEHIIELIKKYPILANFPPQTEGLWKDLLVFKKERSATVLGEIKLPKLQKILPSQISLNNKEKLDLGKLEDTSRYYIGDRSFKEIIKQLTSQNNVIMTFSNIAKLNLAKNILHQVGIKNIGFNRSEQIINHQKLTDFVNKGSFNQSELFFIIKYFSHHHKGLSFLDINTTLERQIMCYLQDNQKFSKHSIVLTTHGGLFNMMQSGNDIYTGYDIAFFDLEYRYKSYNFFLSGNLDLYHILNFIETLIYKYQLLQQKNTLDVLQKFHKLFVTFIGILSIETKSLFTKTAETKIDSNPIMENINFHQSNIFLPKIAEFEHILENCLGKTDNDILQKKLNFMYNLFDKVIIIQKRTYSMDGDFYFIFKESVKYTNWMEFTDTFKDHHVIFFSNYDPSCNKMDAKILPLKNETEHALASIETKKIENYTDIMNFLNKSNLENIFILSTKKAQSKEIFEFLISDNVKQSRDLFVENITGGLGKNAFKIKKKGKKVIIGGNLFLLNLFANKIKIDIIMVYNIRGAWEKNILTDVLWYAS